MAIKDFDFSKVPAGYHLCFHHLCPMRENCLRYVAGQQVPSTLNLGYAIYPSALKDGKCRFFREACEARLAWGFKYLYKHIPHHLRANARWLVTRYLGSVGTYYRYHHGERKLSAEQQEDILNMLSEYCDKEQLVFEHYEPSYNF